uniref:Vacuolar iron transporter n=1 Tax=Oryza punctata TaxID=4537 RepID=A0A0E0KTA6_ORYPU
MDPHHSSHVHAGAAAPNCTCRLPKEEDLAAAVVVVDVEAAPHYTSLKAAEADVVPSGGGGEGEGGDDVNYIARAQWLRAAVLGANDGLVSVASLMIGVGAVNENHNAMLVSGLAGLVAGACSMAIGEFVSVYAQYDIEVSQIERDGDSDGDNAADAAAARENLPSPTQAAFASALAFAVGGLLPLLTGGFIKQWGPRVGVVCASTSAGLAGFGAAGAYLGGANMVRSGTRVLLGGWLAMLVTYAVLRLFATLFHNMNISSSG